MEKLDLISPDREVTHIRGAQKVSEVGKWFGIKPRQDTCCSRCWALNQRAEPRGPAGPGPAQSRFCRPWIAFCRGVCSAGDSQARSRPASAGEKPPLGLLVVLGPRWGGPCLVRSGLCPGPCCGVSGRTGNQITHIQRNLNAGCSGEETAVLSCYPNSFKIIPHIY